MSFLDREQAIAGPGFSRWLVPPAALAVHLAIGQAYALSVFNLPLTRLVGKTVSAPEDWSLSATIWMFNIAFFFLGASAAIFGTWVERVGPRKAMFASALFFASGFFVSAVGVHLHVLALLYLGYGVLGGIGLGLGYISPVSTLLKWFPDRPGMATGMAIMGFGGGAMVGSPLAVALMDRFGVAHTFVAMGVLYLALMMFGAFTVRIPHATTRQQLDTPGLSAREAVRTRAFWLVWIVLFTNVTAGIGVLGQASPMIQEMFGKTPAAAAGFVGILSLFNLAGRFVWSSLSDRFGRKATYAIYLGLGMGLYALVPTTKRLGSVGLFVACTCFILSMYGGGFATVPAYLRDLFGTKQVGAIHGRLLTAWSTAALVGPSLVTYSREAQIARGIPKADAYSTTMYGLVALLFVGFLANALVDSSRRFTQATSAAANTSLELEKLPLFSLLFRWAVVLVPLGWGVIQVVVKCFALFT